MKLVFCGTPQFAVPTLKQLLAAGRQVEMVLTQPDRPSGRKMEVVAPAVKRAALDAGLPVLQPEKIKNNPELRARLEEIRPDAIVIVAYGRIIPSWMLALPPLGNLNLHGSLLPKYRGAAPIQWAIANGEPTTGVTTMRIDEGLDTGDILLQRELAIAPDQTAEDMFPLLAAAGADLMVETLAGLESGAVTPHRQDGAEATLAPILTREDGRVDFARTASEIYNRWRGFQPWPGAYTTWRGKKLTLYRIAPTEGIGSSAVPGEMLVERGRLYVAAGQASWLEILTLQVEGKRALSTAEFLPGAQLQAGERLGG